MITASGRTDLNADHRAFSKSTTTLLTDGTDGSTLMIFLRTLIKITKRTNMSVNEFDVMLCVYLLYVCNIE